MARACQNICCIGDLTRSVFHESGISQNDKIMWNPNIQLSGIVDTLKLIDLIYVVFLSSPWNTSESSSASDLGAFLRSFQIRLSCLPWTLLPISLIKFRSWWKLKWIIRVNKMNFMKHRFMVKREWSLTRSRARVSFPGRVIYIDIIYRHYIPYIFVPF